MARLDFLWQVQAREEKLDMEALQGANRYSKNLYSKVFEKNHEQRNNDKVWKVILACTKVRK